MSNEDITDEEIHDYVYEEVDKFLDSFFSDVFEEFDLDPYTNDGQELLSRVEFELIRIMNRRTGRKYE